MIKKEETQLLLPMDDMIIYIAYQKALWLNY